MIKDVMRLSNILSYVGWRIINGNTEAIRYLYGMIWKESPPLIRLISQLQDCITSVEIENDSDGVYSDEFLYYWGMINLGDQSSLIAKNLYVAETCFQKIKKTFPLAEARLAYIGMMLSEEPAIDHQNVTRLDVLRRWANKQDLFSMIVLARICFFRFLDEQDDEEHIGCLELPQKAITLLQVPCYKGNPVAIRLWNDIHSYTGNFSRMINESRINPYCLYDIKDTCKYAKTPGYLVARDAIIAD